MNKKENKRKGGQPLSLRERGVIEVRWCSDHKTVTDIAQELCRNKSSISRELDGQPRRGRRKYNADIAHRRALDRIAKRGNTPKTVRVKDLRSYIEKRMKLGWSPEQISIRLPIEYKKNIQMRISPEAIYQEVYRRVHRAGYGEVKKGETDLRPLLIRRHKRRAKKGFRKAQKAQQASILPSIEKRPKVVSNRKQFGHWEDDTMVSRQSKGRVKTFNERLSGIHLLGKTKDGTAKACDEVLIDRLRKFPSGVCKTLTRDRGTENLRWEEVSKELEIDVFFAHSYCSYERGSNENNNGLVRRFYPKKTDWESVSDEELAQVEYLINTRPRKRLGGLTPSEVFFKATGVALYS